MSRNRRNSVLARAAIGALYANKEGEGAPASPPSPPPPPAPAPKGKEKEEPKPNTLQLTQEELDARVTAAVKATEDKAAADQKKKDDEAEAAKKKQQGEWQELYEKEQAAAKKKDADNAVLQLKLRQTEVQGRLRDFIAEHNADYAAAAKYIAPLLNIAADTSDADADKQIKAAVEQYVKDNPRARVIGPGPSPQHKLPGDTKVPPKQGETQHRQRFTGPASRF